MTDEKMQELMARNAEMTKAAKQNMSYMLRQIEKGSISVVEALTYMYNIGANDYAEKFGEDKWIHITEEMPVETFTDDDGSMFVDKIPRKRSESLQVLTLDDVGNYAVQASVNGRFRSYTDCDNFRHEVRFWRPIPRLDDDKAFIKDAEKCREYHEKKGSTT